MTSDHSNPLPSPAARALALLLGQFLAVVAFILAGTRAPFAGVPWAHGFDRWFARAAPVDAVAVVAYRGALLVAAWLLAGTLLHLAATLARVPALARASARLALPVARRAVATLVVTAGAASPAVAYAAEDGGPGRVRDGRAVVTTVAPTPAPPPAAPAVPAASGVVVVQPGDSLWTIAASTATRPRPGRDVGAQWLAICELNRSRLRSGDLSMIEPGEEIVLPE